MQKGMRVKLAGLLTFFAIRIRFTIYEYETVSPFETEQRKPLFIPR